MANPIKIVKAVASAAKAEADKIAKNSVKVKPAAKPKPNPADAAKARYKDNSSYNRAKNRPLNPVKESGLSGREGRFGGQHMGGNAGHDFEEIPSHDVMWRDGGDKYGLGYDK